MYNIESETDPKDPSEKKPLNEDPETGGDKVYYDDEPEGSSVPGNEGDGKKENSGDTKGGDDRKDTQENKE